MSEHVDRIMNSTWKKPAGGLSTFDTAWLRNALEEMVRETKLAAYADIVGDCRELFDYMGPMGYPEARGVVAIWEKIDKRRDAIREASHQLPAHSDRDAGRDELSGYGPDAD